MTVNTLLKFIDCPYEVRFGRRWIFIRIRPEDVRNHLQDEVVKIIPNGRKLIILCEVPDYELDPTWEDPLGIDLPWT